MTTHLRKKQHLIYACDSVASHTSIPYQGFDALIRHEIFSTTHYVEWRSLSFFYLKMLVKLLRRDEEIVVHTHHLRSLIVSSLFLVIYKSLNINVTWVHTFHSNPSRFSQLTLQLLKHIFSKFPDQICSVSRHSSRLWQIALNKAEIETVYNFYPSSLSECLENLKSESTNEIKQDGNIIHLAWIGRLEPIKDCALFLKSISTLTEDFFEGVEFKISIVGSGSEAHALRDVASNYCMNKQRLSISFLGYLSRNDVYRVLNSCDIYINTSKDETFCVSALEALLLGVPCLVLPGLDALREIYTADNVKFYNPQCLESLRSCVFAAIENFRERRLPIEMRTFPESGLDRYSEKAFIEKILTIYSLGK